MRAKSEALEKFQDLKAEHRTPKLLRSDIVKEFTNRQFKRFCFENKTKQEITVPETRGQSGMAERANRSVVEMAKCLSFQAKLPTPFWLRSIANAGFLRNHVSNYKRFARFKNEDHVCCQKSDF